MKSALPYASVKTSTAFDDLLGALYMKAKRNPEEIVVPSLQVISVRGNQPPSSKEYQDAIAVLYGIGYGVKMGLKFGKLRRPKGHFDYRVGALGTFWESTSGALNVNDPTTLRWQAYLIVPAFVSEPLVDEARAQAKARHPEIYISDPRRTAPPKLKTVIRLGVRGEDGQAGPIRHRRQP